jgi:hypothetical protein
MSEQASTQDRPAASARPPAELRPTQDGTAQSVDGTAQSARILVLAAVCLGVAALAAAAFVLSYAGIHTVAIQAGISSQYARDYPLLIDAMLVITLLAVLGLRGAGLPSRILSWLALLCVLAAAAGADVLHATGRMLRHTAGAATAAALPWALVLIAFVLLLALLRHARQRHQASLAQQQAPLATDARPALSDQPAATPSAPSLPVRTPRPRDSASIVPGFSARLVSSAAAGAAAGAAAAAAGHPGPAPEASDHDPADDTTPADPPAQPDDTDEPPPETDNAETTPADPPAQPDRTTPADPPAQPDDTDTSPTGTDPAPADPPAEPADADTMTAGVDGVETSPAAEESDDPATRDPGALEHGSDDDLADNMPVFHRMWSTPTPPDS